jgi:hypothetical protein
MAAIARVESGHAARAGAPRRAWPWTLNRGGNGGYFETKGAALAELQLALEAGVTNIDIGCMQLNWRWHGAAFEDPAHMIEPTANTAYAARFLRELHDRLGSWEAAAGAYHSMDDDRAEGYRRKVAAVMSGGEVVAEAEGPMVEEEPTGVVRGILMAAATPLVDLTAPQGDEVMPAAPAAIPLPDWALQGGAVPEGFVLAGPEAVNPRLRRKWDDLAALRAVLAEQP